MSVEDNPSSLANILDMPRKLFVGDIHGHYDSLQRLFDLICPEVADEIYFVGDLIDRGPQSAKVVDFVRRFGSGCVRGNHEDLLLDAVVDGNFDPRGLDKWVASGGNTTLDSYTNAIDTLMEDVLWMKTLPLYIDLGNTWLVHAGLNPDLSLAEQGSHDFCWIRKKFHSANVSYFPDKQIIIGHTMTFTFPRALPGKIVEGPGWSNIDTGAYDSRSGWLTALDWENQKVYQVNTVENLEGVTNYKDCVIKIESGRSNSTGTSNNWRERKKQFSMTNFMPWRKL